MPCNQGDAARTNLIPISVTQEWTDDGGTDDRILFVSNAPEGYGAETEKPILYRAKLTVPASGILKFRAWIWHMRIVETAPDQLFLACKLVGSNGTLGSHRVISGTGGTAPYSNLELLGRCLAKAQLFGTLDGALKLSLPNGVTKVIGSYTVPYSLHPDTQPKVVGAIHEFEIKGQEGNEFYLWTGVAAGNTPPPYGTTDDVALSGDHVR
ncbi:MAG: hypothetical protein IT203_09420, partial [Fimbriimonadaceae bacterium]|nr:hypothetical protein [Fimbriimonadaceae bacterium]